MTISNSSITSSEQLPMSRARSIASPKKYRSFTLLFLWEIEDKIAQKELTIKQRSDLLDFAKSKLTDKIFKDLKTIISFDSSKQYIFIPEYDFTKLGALKTDIEDIFVESLIDTITAIKSQDALKSKKFILTNQDALEETNRQKLLELNTTLGEESLSLKPFTQDSIANNSSAQSFFLPLDKNESRRSQMKLSKTLAMRRRNSVSPSNAVEQPEQSVKVSCCSGLFQRLVMGKRESSTQQASSTRQMQQASSSLTFGRSI